VPRPAVEVADIFRRRGPAWRASHAGHVSLGQLKVMSAIERCRTAALGGHVERCEACAHLRISYNSCRNRRCPKCQAAAAKQWLADRQAELLPVPYFHVVFTLPGPIADIANRNKAIVYDLLLKVAAETLITIAADPKHHCFGPPVARRARPDPASGERDGTENRHEAPEWNACPCCGGRMIIIETFEPGSQPRQWPTPFDRARQLMTSTLLSPSRIAAPVPARYPHCRRRPSANAVCQRRLRPPKRTSLTTRPRSDPSTQRARPTAG
jgi:hypothetical protein